MKQFPVADVFRRFADALDDPYVSERLAVVDPGCRDLVRILDAIGQYALKMGTDLRAVIETTSHGPLNQAEWKLVIDRKLTDEVRRFADMVERKQDLIRVLDPHFSRLMLSVKAINMYAGWLGVDLGLRGRWAVVPEKVEEQR